MTPYSVWISVTKCLLHGPCRAHVIGWMRRQGLVIALLVSWFVFTVFFVSVALEKGPAVRVTQEEQYNCPPIDEILDEPIEPPKPPPDPPAIIPRPTPDSSSLKDYARVRLKHMN